MGKEILKDGRLFGAKRSSFRKSFLRPTRVCQHDILDKKPTISGIFGEPTIVMQQAAELLGGEAIIADDGKTYLHKGWRVDLPQGKNYLKVTLKNASDFTPFWSTVELLKQLIKEL